MVALARLDLPRRAIDPQRQLLGSAGDVDRPSGVAEVALELAEDGRDRKRREADAPAGIEAVEGAEQAHARHPYEVLDRLVRVAVARGELAGQRPEALKQLLAGSAVLM